MRIAIISDIHGNLTALEAVIADLCETAPDLVLHGGDLAAGGAKPAEIVDCVRSLGWNGVLGNTDEMLFRPDSLSEFAKSAPHLQKLFDIIGETAAFTREALGSEPIDWLATLPITRKVNDVALVHASPQSTWVAPAANATDAELNSTYAAFSGPFTVYGHIHHPYVRRAGQRTIINTGSVSLSYDGDPRASYLLIDDDVPAIRRITYDCDCEAKALAMSGTPHADWIAKTLRSASFIMP